MASPTLRDAKVGGELIQDIERYRKHPDCKTLVCFVCDPGEHIANPDGLERDLTQPHGDLDVRVVVRPKH